MLRLVYAKGEDEMDCACGCGEPAVYAARHVPVNIRTKITEADYVVMDCGYETPCWIWKGRRTKKYANIRLRGTQTSIHRAMYTQEVGPIPAGLVIDHLCEETRCVNPSHLKATTSAANCRRSTAFHPSDEQLRAILGYERPTERLAEEYGVSTRTISSVRQRHRRTHVQPT